MPARHTPTAAKAAFEVSHFAATFQLVTPPLPARHAPTEAKAASKVFHFASVLSFLHGSTPLARWSG